MQSVAGSATQGRKKPFFTNPRSCSWNYCLTHTFYPFLILYLLHLYTKHRKTLMFSDHKVIHKVRAKFKKKSSQSYTVTTLSPLSESSTQSNIVFSIINTLRIMSHVHIVQIIQIYSTAEIVIHTW